MSQRSHNSQVMFQKNGTANFIRHCLRTPEDQKWLHRRAREVEANGDQKRLQKLQAEAYK